MQFPMKYCYQQSVYSIANALELRVSCTNPSIWSGSGEINMAWWRHRMETFPALLAICSGNSPVTGEFPAQRSVTQRFDGFFDLRLNKRLSKQSWGWRFDMLWRPLWRHCNVWAFTSVVWCGCVVTWGWWPRFLLSLLMCWACNSLGFKIAAEDKGPVSI